MAMSSMPVLVINPGSTSTKVAIFDGEALAGERVIRHSPQELAALGNIPQQKDLRALHVRSFLQESGVAPKALRAVVGRGGMLRPVRSGTYAVNDRMLEDLKTPLASSHASALGALIAAEIARPLGIPAYVVDPVAVDEMDPVARLSGLPEIARRSFFHALNAKAVARDCAKLLGVPYEEARFVVAHMGGGISVSAHCKGRVIDVNDSLSGEGPLSPERSGSVPLTPLIELCFSGGFTKEEMLDKVRRRGGLLAYLGTSDLAAAERRAEEGEKLAREVIHAMAYQVSKQIGAMAAALKGRINAIVLTGGLARSERFVALIKERVDRFAPVFCYPGEQEMLAMAKGALRVLTGRETALWYE